MPEPMTSQQQAVSERESSNGIDYEKFLDCVHCGLCTSACPTYLETGNENDSPRGRIYLMRAVTDGRLELTDSVTRHLDLCLDCRSCETACPSGVEYGRLIEPFRVSMSDQGNDTSDWFHRWILHGLFPFAKRVRWALLPAKVMQTLALDRLIDKSGLSRLLPQRLQRMQRLLPKLQRREKEIPQFLPAIGEKRRHRCLIHRLCRRCHVSARQLGHGPSFAAQRVRCCCPKISTMLRGDSLPLRSVGPRNAFCREKRDSI